MRRFLIRLVTVGVAALLTMVWGAGSALAAPTWSIDAAPEPPGAVSGALAATDCVTAKLCYAVGLTKDDMDSGGFGYVARMDGGNWLVEPTPTPLVDHSILRDVDCFNGKTCMAVGQYTGISGGPGKAYSLRLKGGAWDVQAMQSPGTTGSGTHMYGVSCPSVNTCFAVGEYRTSTVSDGLIQRWNGSTWSVQSFPLPVTNGSLLYDIDCSSASSCAAVGHYTDPGSGFVKSWAMRWNGTNWSQQSPQQPGVTSGFFGVSCPSASACVAVGLSIESSGVPTPMAQHWNGTAWTSRAMPDLPNQVEFFYKVSCTHANACLAVGFSDTSGEVDSTSIDTALAARWNSDGWRLEQLPQVDQPESRLFGVSCASRSACVAVGNSDNSIANDDIPDIHRPLILRSE